MTNEGVINEDVTNEDVPAPPRRRRWRPWLMFLLGLIVGWLIGQPPGLEYDGTLPSAVYQLGRHIYSVGVLLLMVWFARETRAP